MWACVSSAGWPFVSSGKCICRYSVGFSSLGLSSALNDDSSIPRCRNLVDNRLRAPWLFGSQLVK